MTESITVTDSAGLVAMARDAERHNRNRQVDVTSLLTEVAHGGRHLLAFKMLHEHIAGDPAEPHLRTMWLVKMSGTDEPVTIFLDVGMEVFDDAVFVCEQRWVPEGQDVPLQR